MQILSQEAFETKFKFLKINKVKKILKWFGIIAFLLILLIMIYMLSGFAKPDTKIDYRVKVNASTHLVEVTMVTQPNKILFLDLFLNSIRDIDGNSRLKDLEVRRAGKKIAHWKTIPSLSALERIWVGFSNKQITITYTIDPLVNRGDRGKALSFLADDYGYFRGFYILYTPITFKEGKAFLFKEAMPKSQPGIGTVQFDIPEGWQSNDPWKDMKDISIADLRNTYWGLGKDTDIINVEDISIAMIEDMNTELQKTTRQKIKNIYNEIKVLTGITPEKKSSTWAISILPPVPIHGGAAGEYSLLTENDIATICHEMFHWWNGFTIETESNANWLTEGFTTYYAGKILFETGIWSEDEFNKYIDNLISELYTGHEEPIDLIEASKRLTNNSTSMDDYYQVYNGGALLAYYVDRELKNDSKTLDQSWLMLYELNKVISNEDFINSVKQLSDEEFANQIKEMIEGKRAIPFIALSLK